MVDFDLNPQRGMEKAAQYLSGELGVRRHPQRTPWGIVSRLEAIPGTVRRISLIGQDVLMQSITHSDHRKGTDLAAGILVAINGDRSLVLECRAVELGLDYKRPVAEIDGQQHYEVPVIEFHSNKYEIPSGSIPRRLRDILVRGATVLTVDQKHLRDLELATRDATHRLTTAEVYHSAGSM